MLPDGERIYVNPYDNTNYHMKLEPLASNDTLCYMFALQNIFKNYGINYCMFSYFPIERTEKNERFIKDCLDLSKFLTFTSHGLSPSPEKIKSEDICIKCILFSWQKSEIFFTASIFIALA